MTNALRMPFAKWLYLMSEAKLAPQARALAIYAVVFKITGNDDLARLSGMASKDKADKTFNHWKKHLHDHGWVLLGNRSGGRGRSLEVSPAYKETPVTFTDLCARDPSRFAAPELGVDNTPVSDPQTLVEKTRVSTSDAETSPPSREVKSTPVLAEREVEITPVLVETGVEKTRVSPRARARIEPPSGVLSYEENISPPTPSSPSGEKHVGHGVWVNCETIKHKDFSISLKALETYLIAMEPSDVKAKALAHALQWAAEIEGGKEPGRVVPSKIANFLATSLTADMNRAAVADTRLAKARKDGNRPFKPSRWAAK